MQKTTYDHQVTTWPTLKPCAPRDVCVPPLPPQEGTGRLREIVRHDMRMDRRSVLICFNWRTLRWVVVRDKHRSETLTQDNGLGSRTKGRLSRD